MDEMEFQRLIDSGLNGVEEVDDNEKPKEFVNTIVNCLNITAPRKKAIIKSSWQGKGWFTEDIKKSLRLRDEAYRKARVYRCPMEWEIFKNLRNRVVHMCRQAKKDYLRVKLDNNKRDPKRMWGTLK